MHTFCTRCEAYAFLSFLYEYMAENGAKHEVYQCANCGGEHDYTVT